ncbi:YjbH domain-containing protein [Pseudoalteromonas luteoviolacea]|uniref:YjbH domain-containing protein n=1 Tax=Pseudoalteromonas luteoviolacea TaxID=43657 RepID=UPI001B392171|nr:YjbH domain-containing protein [Pseudoalteromonas luteoviolacea]MBQ4838304.1 YjbH domain-containing protein [Pseudoalteromonas luteoviolacea]
MSKFVPVLLSGLTIVSAPSYSESELDTYRSFTGFTGLVNTSNAEVLETGYWDIGYNNMLDNYTKSYVDGHNFVFSAGLFEGLEVSGLIASSTMHDNTFIPPAEGEELQTRDLSFNAKYQIPFIPKDWFNLSVGSKDIGGAANNYETHFVVASKEWRNFRFSLGASRSKHETGMMNGAFGGIEWMPLDWLAFQVEYDAEAINSAARVVIPKEWLFDLGELSLTSRFYSSTDFTDDDIFWGINFKAPFSKLAQSSKSKIEAAPKPIVSSRPEQRNFKPVEKAATDTQADRNSHDKTAKASGHELERKDLNKLARELRNTLIADGFESVRVGFNSQPTIIVSLENATFNNNEIDALGLAIGRVTEVFSGTSAKFILELQNHGISMMALSGDVASYERFLKDNVEPNINVKMGSRASIAGVTWVGLENANQRFLKPRVTISPEVNSTHATEFGVLDYSLALKADVNLPLWKGAGFNLTAQTVVSESDDFKEKKIFDDLSEDNGVRSAFLYQTYQLPWGIYNQTKVGFFREFHKYKGIINETAWVSPNGSHKFTNTYGYFEYQDFNSDRDYHTLDYQYYWAERDLSFHVTGGKFWRKDKGVKVETRFWFGDSYVAVYGENTNAKVAGVAINIPLSKRKNMNVTKYGQIKGTSSWRHQIGTRIGDSHNKLVYQQAYQPRLPVTLNKTFFNKGRNSVDYVYSNLSRLRNAYLTYK